MDHICIVELLAPLPFSRLRYAQPDAEGEGEMPAGTWGEIIRPFIDIDAEGRYEVHLWDDTLREVVGIAMLRREEFVDINELLPS